MLGHLNLELITVYSVIAYFLQNKFLPMVLKCLLICLLVWKLLADFQ